MPLRWFAKAGAAVPMPEQDVGVTKVTVEEVAPEVGDLVRFSGTARVSLVTEAGEVEVEDMQITRIEEVSRSPQ